VIEAAVEMHDGDDAMMITVVVIEAVMVEVHHDDDDDDDDDDAVLSETEHQVNVGWVNTDIGGETHTEAGLD